MIAFVLPLLTLIGCPQPAPTEATAPGVPMNAPPTEGGAPTGEAGAPAANAEAGNGGAANGGPPADALANMVQPPADLSAIITGGKVKLTGKLEGAEAASVSILEPGATKDDMPVVLAMFQASGGTFTVDVPASYGKTLYVAAFADLQGDGLSPDDLSGATESGVKLEGKDVTVTVKLSTDNAWTRRMPWRSPDAQTDAPPNPASPPPGAPPPAGSAPAPGAPSAPGGPPSSGSVPPQ
jgi:hypothetical protein